MKQLISLVSRILFVGAVLLTGLAVWEKLVNSFGFTLLRGVQEPWRLVQYSVVVLLFVIALQLREIKTSLSKRDLD